MPKTIQYSFVFVTLIVLVSVALGDTFDQTVAQIKTLKVELEENQASMTEKREQVDTLITEFRENHPLGAPQDQFESDADYAARLQQLESAVSQHLAELVEQHLSTLLSRRSQIQIQLARLYRTVFLTDNITATLGTYDANNEFFPITFQLGEQSIETHLNIKKDAARNLYENWEEVSVTGWIVIDPGYRRGLAKVKLVYTPLWEEGVTWTLGLYDLGNNNSIAFSPDGKYLATGSNGEYGIANIWTVEDGEKFRKVDHGDWVYAVAFSPDGQYLATAGQDETRYSYNGKAIIWNMNKGTKIQTIEHSQHIRAVAFSPDSKYLATARLRYSYEGSLFLWKVQGGSIWGTTYRSNSSTINALTFTPDGKYLVTGKVRRYSYRLDHATLWEISDGRAARNFEHKSGVYSVSVSPNGKYLATGNNGSVTLWEVSSGRSVRQIELPNTIAYAVAFSPDGKYLAVGKRNGYIDFFRIGDAEITLETEITKEKSIYTRFEVRDLAWHPDGNLISDGRKVYRTLLEPIVTDLAATPLNTRRDVNNDGVVNVADLVLVAANFGKSFAADANPNPDVNRDGVVDRADIIQIILSLEAAGAPSAAPQLTAEILQRWIDDAKQLNNPNAAFQRGIRVLEQLLTTLTETEAIPEETSLLSNYPNPFNPETWIPYQLAAAADVTVRIYSANGTIVRTLELGHRSAGIYQNRTRAAYWDGRNAQGEQVASGIYFYTLTAGDFTATQKMLLMK